MGVLLSLFFISYSPLFLTLYPGGQQASMGGANVAIAEDAFGVFYNPAGFAFQRNVVLGFEYNKIPWAVRTNYWNFGINVPLNNKISLGVLGAGIYCSPIEGYNDDSTSINSIINDFTTGLSFTYKISNYLGVGMNVKYIYSSMFWSYGIYSHKNLARSFGTDVGVLGLRGFKFGRFGAGLAVQNLGPKMKFSDGGEDNLPISVKVGASYAISAKDFFNKYDTARLKTWFLEKWRVIISYDINKIITKELIYTWPTEPPKERGENLWRSFGVEIRPIPVFAIRFGHFDDYDNELQNRRSGWTFGLGLDFKFLRIDFSDDAAFYLLASNRWKVSLSLNVGDPIFPKGGLLSYLTN